MSFIGCLELLIIPNGKGKEENILARTARAPIYSYDCIFNVDYSNIFVLYTSFIDGICLNKFFTQLIQQAVSFCLKEYPFPLFVCDDRYSQKVDEE